VRTPTYLGGLIMRGSSLVPARLSIRPDRRLFARLPPAADYALLSPSVRHYAYGAPQRRASVAGRPRPGTAALNELSAPGLTIHDVPHRGIMPVIEAQRASILVPHDHRHIRSDADIHPKGDDV